MPREFAVKLPFDEIVATIQQALSDAGFRVEQSFDLRSALTQVPDCTCPHHGTALCDCHYSVLLVYGQTASELVTLVIHGRDGLCWLTVADPPEGRTKPGLAVEIVLTLAIARLITLNEDGDVHSSASAAH